MLGMYLGDAECHKRCKKEEAGKLIFVHVPQAHCTLINLTSFPPSTFNISTIAHHLRLAIESQIWNRWVLFGRQSKHFSRRNTCQCLSLNRLQNPFSIPFIAAPVELQQLIWIFFIEGSCSNRSVITTAFTRHPVYGSNIRGFRHIGHAVDFLADLSQIGCPTISSILAPVHFFSLKPSFRPEIRYIVSGTVFYFIHLEHSLSRSQDLRRHKLARSDFV